MGQQMFAKEIQAYQAELNQILAMMEQAREQFVEVTAAHLAQWYQTQARFYVQDQYERTLSIGPDRLSQMKGQVAQLVAMAPESTQRILDDDELWWHRSRDGGWRDPFAEGPPEPLKKAIKRLGNLLTPILLQYGYIKQPPETTQLEVPKDKPKVTQKSVSRFAPPEMEWSEKMDDSIRVYKNRLGRATFLDGKIREATKLMKKYQAGALWDKV